jgi:hypothetical protein
MLSSSNLLNRSGSAQASPEANTNFEYELAAVTDEYAEEAQVPSDDDDDDHQEKKQQHLQDSPDLDDDDDDDDAEHVHHKHKALKFLAADADPHDDSMRLLHERDDDDEHNRRTSTDSKGSADKPSKKRRAIIHEAHDASASNVRASARRTCAVVSHQSAALIRRIDSWRSASAKSRCGR